MNIASIRSTHRMLIVGSLLAFLACGSDVPDSRQAPAQAVPTATPKAAPPPAAPRKLPEKLPADIPLLPGAEMKNVSPPTDEGVSVTFEVAGSVPQALGDYTKLLQDDGWVVVSMEDPDGWALMAQKPGATAMASFVPGGAGVVVNVVVADHE